MSAICTTCGKHASYGNNVSHAHNTTRRKWKVNLKSKSVLISGKKTSIKICTKCIKSGKHLSIS